ncbi:hypothetical protein V1477_011619 [Vespula maculifrons]|uniref:Uncharacterized protein n=1 Tax=Vespula maculifrons TaxID=7453 RepID=A0ABD2BZR9_VESMC
MSNESTKSLFPYDDKKVDTTWFVFSFSLLRSYISVDLVIVNIAEQLPPSGEIRKSVLSTVSINFLWFNVGTTEPMADVRCIREL